MRSSVIMLANEGMKEIFPKIREEIADDVKRIRKVERTVVMPDKRLNEKRNRPAGEYVENLRGLQATLDYVRNLPIKKIVDLGAGTSRAIAKISHTEYGEGIEFMGTGIVLDPEIDKNIGRENYRITPAETMRGFEPSSVGGFISVYGPFEHSAHVRQVLEKAHELLIPGGILKFCVMKNVPGAKPEMNELYVKNVEDIEDSLRREGYEFVKKDWDIVGRIGTSRTFLAIKRIGEERKKYSLLAEEIMEGDLEGLKDMKADLAAPDA